ncbi:TauD/TfdA dioxygenase family protein [Gordonia phthalatica]|uniref:Taurine dioxygenase n=1 Tax=Gordonia phthalatica TaxID=1136941 RepID=A0A0N7FU32_9ACTN|nr:TauD/TfdA family dioxygenase [Gordonia phthalatica]ALG83231.1 taurine dioxygenase [Gordonia phthalatica]
MSTPTFSAHYKLLHDYSPSGPLVAHPPASTDGYTRITVSPLSPTIGAEISGVRLGGDIDEDTLAEIRRAQLDWKVLFFRDQDITRVDQREFAKLWGELEQHPFYKHLGDDQTDVDVQTLDRSMANGGGVENGWHNDVSWHTHPSHAAVLRAVEVPPVGGDTLWSDTGAAYDTLPEELKERIEHLVAEHDWMDVFGVAMPPETAEALRPHFPPQHHPVVRVIPETGRKVLFVNLAFTTRILGVSDDESTDILTRLYRHVARPEFQVRLKWQPNTIAFWDNRTCQHYAASDYFPMPRVMERISIVGDVPIGVSAR